MRRMRQAFDDQLVTLNQDIAEMGDFVGSMLSDSIDALVKQDTALATDVVARDDTADRMDLTLEQTCVRLLALQQPMSKDLRTIGTALKIISDLERIGDYAVDIARTARILTQEPFFKPLVDIPQMSRIVIEMLQTALHAFTTDDMSLARKVAEDDEQVDRLWYSLQDELMLAMQQSSDLVVQATYLLLVARYLERIADHTVNVAERVAFVITGEMQTLVSSHSTR